MRREFSSRVKVAAFERCGGLCEDCGAVLRPGHIRYDHDKPDALGGEPTLENCKVRCDLCDAPKTSADISKIAKSDRIRAKHLGAKPRRSRPVPGSRNSPWKKHLDGTVTRR